MKIVYFVLKTLMASIVAGALPAVIDKIVDDKTTDPHILIASAVTGAVLYLMHSPRKK